MPIHPQRLIGDRHEPRESDILAASGSRLSSEVNVNTFVQVKIDFPIHPSLFSIVFIPHDDQMFWG